MLENAFAAINLFIMIGEGERKLGGCGGGPERLHRSAAGKEQSQQFPGALFAFVLIPTDRGHQMGFRT